MLRIVGIRVRSYCRYQLGDDIPRHLDPNAFYFYGPYLSGGIYGSMTAWCGFGANVTATLAVTVFLGRSFLQQVTNILVVLNTLPDNDNDWKEKIKVQIAELLQSSQKSTQDLLQEMTDLRLFRHSLEEGIPGHHFPIAPGQTIPYLGFSAEELNNFLNSLNSSNEIPKEFLDFIKNYLNNNPSSIPNNDRIRGHWNLPRRMR